MELWFVEALIVLAALKDSCGESAFRMTNDQVVAVMQSRHPEAKVGVQTFERLKRRYVSRPGKPAERFELLRETFKGSRKPGQQVGVPSEYERTGLAGLLPGLNEVAQPQSSAVA
jgi:hypothetical protein